MGPYAQQLAASDLGQSAGRGPAWCHDLHHLDVLQSDERWAAQRHGRAHMTADVLLDVRNLKRYFPVRGGLLQRKVATVQAVDDVSFSVRRGETLGIVGESGCGKSTTARLLIRLIPPDSGSIVFDGDMVGEPRGISVNEMRRQMQMVFQDSYSSLNPRMTMAESIAYAPRMHGVSRKQAFERAESLLSRVGLNAGLYARRYPHELSGGQRQRVNIARALALEPRMVILDE